LLIGISATSRPDGYFCGIMNIYEGIKGFILARDGGPTVMKQFGLSLGIMTRNMGTGRLACMVYLARE